MKSFIFRICAIVLLIIGITTYIYSDALAYRKETFEVAEGDVFMESMDFTHFVTYTTRFGSSYSVVGGVLYPEDDRNSHKNSFFKLYDKAGNIVSSEALHEENCDVIITDIGTSKDGFSIVCEVRGAEKFYGKSFVYDEAGRFLHSTDIKYGSSSAQVTGTKYCISQNNDTINYIAIDTDKVTVTDSKGSYKTHIELDQNITINDAVIYGDTLYTAGSYSDKDDIPYSSMYAYSMSNNALMWKQENILLPASIPATYSQIDDICILTDKSGANSIIVSAKYFDSVAYVNYINTIMDASEYKLDTIAKNSLKKMRPLYLTAELFDDYKTSPLSSELFIKFDMAGKQVTTKKYDCTSKKSVSALTSTVSQNILPKEEFHTVVAVADNAQKSDSYLNFSIFELDSDLKETAYDSLKSDAKNKTYITVTQKGELFAYTSINTTNRYSSLYFKNATAYIEHLGSLSKANYKIQNFKNIVSDIPFMLMYTIIYITARIKLIQSGSNLHSFACTYLHKLKSCIAGYRAKQKAKQQ